jgi:Glycosyl hydrolase family 3 C-terminal domain
MSAYNEVNGVPSPANVHLIDTLARETYGFRGFFTSDCDAIYIMQAGHHWQPPGYPAPVDPVSRGAFANSAGEDLADVVLGAVNPSGHLAFTWYRDDSQLPSTVGMNDERLYGYITRGASTPLPPRTSVSYRSNRPSVVAVGPSGTIRTVRRGVATITATVTYHGVRRSTSFVVYVR